MEEKRKFHELKTAGLTKRRNTVLTTFVREYEQFDIALEQKENEKKLFQQKLDDLQEQYTLAMKSSAEKDTKIDELNKKVIELNRTIKGQEEEVTKLKASVRNNENTIRAAILAEKNRQERKVIKMKAKCSKLRGAHQKVINDLQQQLTKAQRYIDDNSSDDEPNTNTVNNDESQQKGLDSNSVDGDSFTVSSSDDEVGEKSSKRKRPFNCSEPGCQRSYKSKSALTKHMRTHKDEKPFPCDFSGCGQAFIQKTDLERHKRTHTGAKPFTCKVCAKNFSQMSNLKTHLKTHT